MKAMIFAAGLGSRLKPLTDTRPKALVTVAGKPMLEHVILKLKAAGCNKIVINVHHFADQILAFLEANQNFGVDIEISDETEYLLDTGGGLENASWLLCDPDDEETQNRFTSLFQEMSNDLKNGVDKQEVAQKFIGGLREECYLIHNVDILSNCDLESLVYYHQNCPDISVTLLVSPRKTTRYLLFDEDNLLRGWVNKETMETKPIGFKYKEGEYKEYAYSGIHVISPGILKLLPQGKYSIIDFYLSMCNKIDIQGYVEEDLQLIDIGKPETLEKAEEFLSKLEQKR